MTVNNESKPLLELSVADFPASKRATVAHVDDFKNPPPEARYKTVQVPIVQTQTAGRIKNLRELSPHERVGVAFGINTEISDGENNGKQIAIVKDAKAMLSSKHSN